MNRAILIGRLVADPTSRTTQSGSMVANYTLAVDKQVKAEGQPTADFIDCVAFGRGAEFAQKYLNKGGKIAVEGRIQTRNWEDKDGNKRKSVEVIVDRHEFVESRQPASANTGGYELPLSDLPDEWAEGSSDLPF